LENYLNYFSSKASRPAATHYNQGITQEADLQDAAASPHA